MSKRLKRDELINESDIIAKKSIGVKGYIVVGCLLLVSIIVTNYFKILLEKTYDEGEEVMEGRFFFSK